MLKNVICSQSGRSKPFAEKPFAGRPHSKDTAPPTLPVRYARKRAVAPPTLQVDEAAARS